MDGVAELMARIRSIHINDWPVAFRGQFRHLYVVQENDDGPVKIGIAANAFWRLSELQIGNHRRLRLRAVFEGQDKRHVFELEQRVHARLAEFSISGEWFSCSSEHAISTINEEIL